MRAPARGFPTVDRPSDTLRHGPEIRNELSASPNSLLILRLREQLILGATSDRQVVVDDT